MLDASVLSQISDEQLFDVHDGLHSLAATQDVAKTFASVAKEMSRRGLVVKALYTNTTVPGKSDIKSGDKKRGVRTVGKPSPDGTDEDVDGALPDTDANCTVKKDSDGDDDDDGPAKCSNFVPVRDVCRNCKNNSASHKQVAKGLYVINKSRASDFLNGMAGAGAAMSGTPSMAGTPSSTSTDAKAKRQAKIDAALNAKPDVDTPADMPGQAAQNRRAASPANEYKDNTGYITSANPTGANPTGSRRGAQPGHSFNGNQYTKSDYSVEQRRAMAEKGQAMPDGSFPIANEADLHHAVRLVGQGSDPQAAMQHIIERSKSMGMEEALPEGWTAQEKENAKPEPQPGAHGMANDSPAPAPAQPSKTKKSLTQRIMDGVVKALDGEMIDTQFQGTVIDLDNDFSYAVVKSATDKRRTLGPVYMPDTIDAHGEWASASDLEEATVNYVKSGDRTIFLQHSDIPAGEWYGVMPWPFEETARMTVVDNGVKKAAETTFPPGTVYMGIEWNDWAWDEIKSGRLGGLSMGGTARRVEGVPA